MRIQKVYAVYFSPTHGTKTYVEGITRRLSASYQSIDLTRPENRGKKYNFSANDLVVFGAPVYAGRLPIVSGGIFDCLEGNHTPAIFNVSYGNRAYDDALLEEKRLCEKRGFVGIAAAAWIAPHTFSEKIGANRPDKDDEKQMDIFAGKVQELLHTVDVGNVSVKGNYLYKKPMSMPFHPAGNKNCSACGTCVAVCPTGAIDPKNPRKTNAEKCIDCLACVKNCPEQARSISNPVFKGIVWKLEKDLIKNRKEPEFF